MNLHLRQVAIGSNDCPQHNLSFLAIEARRAGVAFDFSQSSSQRFGQPAMIDFGGGDELVTIAVCGADLLPQAPCHSVQESPARGS